MQSNKLGTITRKLYKLVKLLLTDCLVVLAALVLFLDWYDLCGYLVVGLLVYRQTKPESKIA